MFVNLRNKFQVSSIILTSFRQGVILLPPTSKRARKKPTQIKVNEERDYSEVNTSYNKDFYSTILQSFQFEPEQIKICGNESHQKQTNHIHSSPADLLHVRIRNLDRCKCVHCKIEARGIDCLCCREVVAMLIASTKIPEQQGIIPPSSFYGQLPDYWPHVLALSTQWTSSFFCSWCSWTK